MNEFACAISGEEAEEEELIDDDDGLPVGWTRVTIERRKINPRWVDIQNTKANLVQAALSQVPEEYRDANYPLLALQIDAQFAYLEVNTEQYLMTSETVYVSPIEGNPEVAKTYNDVRGMLSLDPIEEESEESE
jgi:hypothetical protein